MSLMLAETIADKTIAYITANQATKLAAVEARSWTHALSLGTSFKAIRLSDPDQERENDFPVLYVMPDLTDLDEAAGHSVLEGTHGFEFAILAYSSGVTGLTPAETVRRLAMRYALALYEMLGEMHSHSVQTYWANGAPIHWGTGDVTPRIAYGPTYTNGAGEYLADVRLQISAQHTEAR